MCEIQIIPLKRDMHFSESPTNFPVTRTLFLYIGQVNGEYEHLYASVAVLKIEFAQKCVLCLAR